MSTKTPFKPPIGLLLSSVLSSVSVVFTLQSSLFHPKTKRFSSVLAMKHLIGSNPWINSGVSRVLRVLSYSTKTLSPTTSPLNAVKSLHRRVSQTGDPRASVVPVLNQWLEEGKPIKQGDLRTLIRTLRSHRRFKHALEISEWMNDEMSHKISSADIAVRLDLIGKVHDADEAEKFFDNLPDTMRTFQVYGALLSCYAHNKQLEKAEATMQSMKDLGFPIKTVAYNVMLTLYCQQGKYDKLDVLMQEMQEKGIHRDTFSNNIRLNGFASVADIEGMENFLTNMENDAGTSIDWHAFVVAAKGYLKAGLTEKALQMLDRSEQIVPFKARKHAYEVFLTIYTNVGRKDEVYRIWKLYGNLGNFYNSGYLCMISSLIKLDDLEGAEEILAEWESGYRLYDARIPNLLINAYCKSGLTAKAQAYTNGLMERGVIKEPDAFTWKSLANGYVTDGQMAEAVEAMKKAILVSFEGFKPSTVTLAACLDFLKGENNTEAAEELLQLLRDRDLLSDDVYDRLAINIRDRNLDASALDLIKGDKKILDEEVQGAMDVKYEGSN